MSLGDYQWKLSPQGQKKKRLKVGRSLTNVRAFPLIKHLLHCPTTSKMKLLFLLVPLVQTSYPENPFHVKVSEAMVKHFYKSHNFFF